MSDTCNSYKKVLFHTSSELKPQPGMLIVVDSDCYLEQQNEHTGKNLYHHESKVKGKNYLKYWEYMPIWQPCDVYIYRKTKNVVRHLQNFMGWERTPYKNATTSICLWTISWVISTRRHVTVCLVCCMLKNQRSFFPECQGCMIPTFAWHNVNDVGWPCFLTSVTTILIRVHPPKQ